MPIEIRELHIKAEISESGNSQDSSANQSNTGGSASSGKDLIQEVVDQVLEILKHKNER